MQPRTSINLSRMPCNRRTISGNFSSPVSTSEFLDVVSDGLHPKHAFAFGIDLQRKQAATQFENRQIIHRSLDRHFPGHPLLSSCSLGWTTLDPQDGLDLFHIQGTPASIDQSLKHLFHQPALGEHQIPTVLDLIDGILILKPALRSCSSLSRAKPKQLL